MKETEREEDIYRWVSPGITGQSVHTVRHIFLLRAVRPVGPDVLMGFVQNISSTFRVQLAFLEKLNCTQAHSYTKITNEYLG